MTAPIIASDMDGTLTTAETWRGVLEWVRAFHPSVAARFFVLVRLPAVVRIRLGFGDREAFRSRWLLDEARLLRGVPEADLVVMGEWVVDRHLWPARRGPALDAVVSAAQAARAADPATGVVLATATYQPIAEAFARRLGADTAIGTPLEVRDGIATGALASPVRSGSHKAEAVREMAAGREVLAAFGDSVADVALLEMAHRAVAVAPDAALRRIAVARGWEILDASA